MKNKIFLIGSILTAIIIFAVFSLKNSSEPKVDANRVDSSLLVKFNSPTKGSADAKVTIIEFLDPECEACRAMHPILKELLREFDGKVKLVIRYMPLHRNSVYAAAVLEEARARGKFDEALDLLFQNQPEWGSHHAPRPELIPTYLESLGISSADLAPSVVIEKYRSMIEADRKDGELAGVRQTPTFFVNGIMLPKIGYEPLKTAIEKALQE